MKYLNDFNKFTQSEETNEGLRNFGKKAIIGAAMGASLLGNPFQSCTPDDDNIENVVKQKHINPEKGFLINANLVLKYYNPGNENYIINSQQFINTAVQGNISLNYQPNNDYLTIDGQDFEVLEVDQESISYKDGDLIYILEFNEGYIYDGTSTRVKFDKYKEGERYKAFDQYAF
jgi:hypothetical protein